MLGTVGVAFPQTTGRITKRDSLYFSAAAACLFVLFVTTLVLNWAGVRLTAHAVKSVVGT